MVIGSLRLDPAVEGNRRPVVPMSVRLNGHLWAGGGRRTAVNRAAGLRRPRMDPGTRPVPARRDLARVT